MAKNYYDVLGVKRNASQDEIKNAYRDLCKKYHPDRNGGDDTKFKEVNEAYSVLGDPTEKAKYDGIGQNPFGGFNGRNGFHFQMSSDIHASVTISIDEAYFGCKRNITVNGRVFSVDIPKGITNGKLLRIPGLGNQGYDMRGNISTGDLILKVGVENGDMWVNSDGLLEVMCGVDWIDAILGGEVTMKVFDRDVKVRVPKYTKNMGYTVIGNQGFRKFKSDELGSLKVNFVIRMPKNLSDENIGLLKKIKESL